MKDLFDAVTDKDIEAVRNYIEGGGDINRKNEWGWTPLHVAVMEENLEMSEFLILQGSDIHARDLEGSTPLHLAADSGCLETVELLLKNGARVNEKNDKNRLPLYYAEEKGHEKTAELLKSYGASSYSDIFDAASKNDRDAVGEFIKSGVDINVKDRNDRTLLHIAAQNNYLDLADYLLSFNPALNGRDCYGETPLHLAKKSGHIEMVEKLHHSGALDEVKPEPSIAFQEALERGMKSRCNFPLEIDKIRSFIIKNDTEARVLCDALRKMTDPATIDSDDIPISTIASFFMTSVSGIYTLLRQEGLPLLLAVYDRVWEYPGMSEDEYFARGAEVIAAEAIAGSPKVPRTSEEIEHNLLIPLKIFVMYSYEEGLRRVVRAAGTPGICDSRLWETVVLQPFVDISRGLDFPEDVSQLIKDPFDGELFSLFSSELPDGQAGLMFLDYCNRLALDGKLGKHPFNSPRGLERLKNWLSSRDPRHYGCALAASATIPFMEKREHKQLLALGSSHPDPLVQMEAAWASVKCGDRRGFDILRKMCRDPRYFTYAMTYLKELGRDDYIPWKEIDSDFTAKALMCNWLSSQAEYRRPPEKIEILNSRVLFWPPANQQKALYLLKYAYTGGHEDDTDLMGVGLLIDNNISVLPREDLVALPAESIYGIYCSYALIEANDPRAPGECSSEAGLEILRRYQSDI